MKCTGNIYEVFHGVFLVIMSSSRAMSNLATKSMITSLSHTSTLSLAMSLLVTGMLCLVISVVRANSVSSS
jgi:hypothetical protein